ncbi:MULTISPECIES: TetR/AcrR family transcriptional regulator [Mycolicibacterium]|uniref:TetR family transcriptional regulator n=2 Tax=Mycolicibacterium gilvum TaxID=1804 RepID=A0A378SNV7_9MYCO|nr:MULTISPECIES: TetR/AcrR family transcriptional regulator [Mycolicibacterium]ABP45980.1 transcriptional regulator, TetR family [Mycolicibacterium gilvum PYR-GCK]STZ43606.1 TetR family transcriptional regulator [Mycolicibacterium gilvum]
MSHNVTSSAREDPRIGHSRRVILRAALAEFAAHGYTGFRMESVAARAEVGRSTVYRHWPDKGALIADALAGLSRQPDPAHEDSAATARRRAHILLNHLAQALTDSPVSACVPALIHAAANDDAFRDRLHRFSAQRRQRLTATIAEGVASGEFPPTVDPEIASAALSGAVFYRALMTADAPDTDFVADLLDEVLGR